jgi:hypothetical protein
MGSDRVAHSAEKRRETVDFPGPRCCVRVTRFCLSLLVLHASPMNSWQQAAQRPQRPAQISKLFESELRLRGTMFSGEAFSFRRESYQTLDSRTMPSREEEMSLAIWQDLLGRELKIAFEELEEIRRRGGSKRHEHYAQSCADQYRTLFARNFGQWKKMIVPNASVFSS